MKFIKKYIVFVITRMIYFWGSIWYDKKYLTGKFFDKYHNTVGWKWILKCWFPQKVLGYARSVKWPVSCKVTISYANHIVFDSNDMDNFFSPGCYYQASDAKIYIGSCTKIGPNCGIITANHDLNDLEKHTPGKDVVIGNNCWLGMNSVLLPGVKLGDHTIVGAGSVVTKSFEEGNCVIAGNPAKIIKKL